MEQCIQNLVLFSAGYLKTISMIRNLISLSKNLLDKKFNYLQKSSFKTWVSYVDRSFWLALMMTPAERTQ